MVVCGCPALSPAMENPPLRDFMNVIKENFPSARLFF